jgi:hypothetical protein
VELRGSSLRYMPITHTSPLSTCRACALALIMPMLFWELGTFADGLGGGAPPGSLSGKRSRAASPLRLTQARDGDGGFPHNPKHNPCPASTTRACPAPTDNVGRVCNSFLHNLGQRRRSKLGAVAPLVLKPRSRPARRNPSRVTSWLHVGFVNNIADLYPACPQRLCTVADTNVRYN